MLYEVCLCTAVEAMKPGDDNSFLLYHTCEASPNRDSWLFFLGYIESSLQLPSYDIAII